MNAPYKAMGMIARPPTVLNKAKDQLYERYGLNLTVAEWFAAIGSIKDGTAAFVGKNPDGSEIWSISVADDRKVKVIYWPEPRNQIVAVTQPLEKDRSYYHTADRLFERRRERKQAVRDAQRADHERAIIAKAERIRMSEENTKNQSVLFVKVVSTMVSKEVFTAIWDKAREMFPDDPAWNNPKKRPDDA